MDSDGSNVVQLTSDASTHRSPAFSPDGSKIAFWSDASGRRNIYVMDADGCNLRQLTVDAESMDPAWSPDGSRIVFISNRASPTTWLVYTMDPDGNNVISLGAVVQNWQSRPVFSPDGQRIVFASTRDDFFGSIFVVNADGSGLEKLTPAPMTGQYAVWSQDGTKIAFLGSLDPRRGEPWKVYVMDLATRNLTPITDFRAEPHAWAWAPLGAGATCHVRATHAKGPAFQPRFSIRSFDWELVAPQPADVKQPI